MDHSPAIHRNSDNSNNSLIESTKTPPKKGKKLIQQQQGQAACSTNNMSPSLAKNAFKNAKITNFFTKVNNPSSAASDGNQSDNHPGDNHDSNDFVAIRRESSRDSSASGMRQLDGNNQNERTPKIDYVYIHPSSDDDTNNSAKNVRRIAIKPEQTRSPSRASKRTRDNVKVTTNDPQQQPSFTSFKDPSTTNQKKATNGSSEYSPVDKKKKSRVELISSSSNNNNGSSSQSPTRNNNRSAKMVIDFQSVPSDLNLPKPEANALIKRMFLVDMPDDFHQFWDFAKTINHRKPSSAFTPHLNWTLTGPFDVLSGLITDFHGFSKEKLLCHCRYYYDPPEFQTLIIKNDADLTHHGYYRDEPKQKNPIVVANYAAKGCQIQAMGDNLFTLLKSEIDAAISSLSQSSQEKSTKQPQDQKQSQLERAKTKQELEILRDKLIDYCHSTSRHENPISYESWSRTKNRKSKIVAKTLNGFGIVVPMSGDCGYRSLGIADKKLMIILDRISKFTGDNKAKCAHYNELYQLILNTSTANEECDFGMGLELGLDLFFQGDKFFHKNSELLLTSAYKLLDRAEFIEILQAHLAHRKRGYRVSLLLVEK